MEKIMIDAMGKQCPIPVVMMKKALDEQPQVSCAEILVDNEIAVKNLAKLANSQNCSFQWKKLEEKKYQVVLTRNSQGLEAMEEQISENDPGAAQTVSNCCFPEDRTVVAISSAAMGNGNDELGHTLMKGFLYALSQLEKLPEKILFYNGGGYLDYRRKRFSGRSENHGRAGSGDPFLRYLLKLLWTDGQIKGWKCHQHV